MTMASSVLVFGRDPLLLDTRASVLRHAGFRVQALAPSKGPQTAERVNLLVLCHTLDEALETLINLNDLILNASDTLEQAKYYARLGEEQLSTLSRIARQSLNFARLSEARKPVDLVYLAEAALRIHHLKVDAKRIHLVKRFPTDLIAEVQQGQFLQVVSNLTGNALEAHPEEGKLTLKLRKYEDAIDVIVGDSGLGISSNHVEKLFQSFFMTKGAAGDGLGLSLRNGSSMNMVARSSTG